MVEDNAALTGVGDYVRSALRRLCAPLESPSMRNHMRYQKGL